MMKVNFIKFLKLKDLSMHCLKLSWVPLYTTLKSFPLSLFSWATTQPKVIDSSRTFSGHVSLMSTISCEGLRPVEQN